MNHLNQLLGTLFCLGLSVCSPASAQFRDDLNGGPLTGWRWSTGDGTATIDASPGDGFASVFIDATTDKRNIWWAVFRRQVTGLDLAKLKEPGYELRVETRVRISHAPRRVNLHLSTQRTTDDHSHLMEYDLPEAGKWFTLSMTTRDFDAVPGDRVGGHIALIDAGLGKYRLDMDYFKVDVVNAAAAGPDLGEPLPYRPAMPGPETFAQKVRVAHDSMVDLTFPGENYNQWYAAEAGKKTNVLTISATQFAILRWDLSAFAGKQAAGPGLLELTTHSVQRTDSGLEEFGMVRVAEILGGDPQWDQQKVTLANLLGGRPMDDVFNPQLIIDVPVAEQPGGKTLVTLSRPVLQRMIDGKTLGIVIRPQGSINAALFATENGEPAAPRLYFNLKNQ